MRVNSTDVWANSTDDKGKFDLYNFNRKNSIIIVLKHEITI